MRLRMRGVGNADMRVANNEHLVAILHQRNAIEPAMQRLERPSAIGAVPAVAGIVITVAASGDCETGMGDKA